jgi:hypothetical protein
MAKNKTIQTNNSVLTYVNGINDEKKRQDCAQLIELLHAQTGLEAKMWGTSIIGFGSYHYTYKSGHRGEAPLISIASRTNALTIYLASDSNQKQELLQQVGKHKTGKGCLYIQKLEDIDLEVLRKMVVHSIESIQRLYPS